jgi:hypothetical protein
MLPDEAELTPDETKMWPDGTELTPDVSKMWPDGYEATCTVYPGGARRSCRPALHARSLAATSPPTESTAGALCRFR